MPAGKKRKAGILSLPPELLDQILDDVSTQDMCNMRLAGPGIASRLWNSRFGDFIVDARIDLTASRVERLLHLANNDAMRLKMRSLTLRAVVYDTFYCSRTLETRQDRMVFSSTTGAEVVGKMTKSQLHRGQVKRVRQVLAELEKAKLDMEAFFKTGTALHLLEVAFQKIQKLDKLSIQGVAYANRGVPMPPVLADWTETWISASRSYFTVLAALAQSRLMVDNLDVFSETLGCSLPFDMVWRYSVRLDRRGMSESLKNIKNLSIGFSEPPRLQHGDLTRSQVGNVSPIDPLRFPGPLLRHCELLETLKLHLFLESTFSGVNIYLMPTQAMQHISRYGIPSPLPQDLPRFSKLKTLELDGFHLELRWLVIFLSSCPELETLTLRMITIRSEFDDQALEAWRKTFDHLAKRMPYLRRVTLDKLFTTRSFLKFRSEGELLEQVADLTTHSFAGKWEGEEIRRGIRFEHEEKPHQGLDLREPGMPSPVLQYGPGLRMNRPMISHGIRVDHLGPHISVRRGLVDDMLQQ